MASSKRKAPLSQKFQTVHPATLESDLQQAVTLHRAGELSRAKAIYAKILAVQPEHFTCLQLLGTLALQTEDFASAERWLSRAVRLRPGEASLHVNLAIAQAQQNKEQAALESMDRALAIKPDWTAALENRGAILVQAQRYPEAVEQFERLIAAGHGPAEVWSNHGIALMRMGRHGEALDSYRQALAVTPGYPKALCNMGFALIETRRYTEAIAVVDEAIAANAHYADALSAKGQALQVTGRMAEARGWHERAAALKPGNAQILVNYANCLGGLRQLEAALMQVENALTADPGFVDAYVAGGQVLAEMRRYEDAIANYDKAIAIAGPNGKTENAHHFKAVAEFQLGKYADAIRSLECCPDNGHLGTRYLLQDYKMRVCDWSGIEESLARMREDIVQGSFTGTPFSVLALVDDPELQMRAAEAYLAQRSVRNETQAMRTHAWHDKIRIGYFSADFHDHATMFLMAELFESHDLGRFEIYGFSFGPAQSSPMLDRVARQFSGFFDVHAKSDGEIVAQARALGIDIAVDLKGFTLDARIGIFAERCAPIQVSYLGYPGTTGAKFIDYMIADPVVIPENQRRHYSEHIVYLPHSYQCNDSQRAVAERSFRRSDMGLPEQGVVFCCFNNNYKVLPATFEGWMRILQAVEGSVLWLLQDNPWVVESLRKRARECGVDDARLVFAQRMPLPEHLARHRCADLFLDTLPCNAHTTASDALWAGLPVLTCMGKSFASRVAASLLTAVGLPELITQTRSEFEARAIQLAQSPQALQALRDTLARQRLASPLFDGKRFAKHLEAAYAVMVERHKAGQEPAMISIAS
ncbi:tetratricopeptide repeat protein [Alicycliphilus sp. T452]|jgi:predicted O-linked N-acetylglucosamine transferase (SPINDLY family)